MFAVIVVPFDLLAYLSDFFPTVRHRHQACLLPSPQLLKPLACTSCCGIALHGFLSYPVTFLAPLSPSCVFIQLTVWLVVYFYVGGGIQNLPLLSWVGRGLQLDVDEHPRSLF